MSAEIQSVRIFIAYSSKDLTYKEEIRKRLKPLVRAGKVTIWDNYDIEGGADWDADIRKKLETSDLILLLLSPDALDSDYFYDVEAPIALRRHKAGEALAVGVLLRPCALKHTPFDFAQYELLPKKGYPVTDPHWPNADAAYLTIFEEIDLLVEKVEEIRGVKTSHAQFQNNYTISEYISLLVGRNDIKGAIDVLEQHASASEIDIFLPVMLRSRLSAWQEKSDNKTEEPRDLEVEINRIRFTLLEMASQISFADLMVPIKGGTFDMGDTFGDGGDSEKPGHRVTVKDFYLCKYPVTQAQWEQIMGDNPSHFKGDDLPVEQVSWDDAQKFIKKLNEKTGKKYRLPSEAEWEYAARGGNQSKGYKYAGSDNLNEVAWYNDNAGSKTHPVGQKKANELGLFDMSGNVWEWCADAWHDDYKGAPADGSAWIDDAANSAVLRGGSWNNDDDTCRSARRNGLDRDNRTYGIGLRLARAASEGGM